jgi:hypothetical protein
MNHLTILVSILLATSAACAGPDSVGELVTPGAADAGVSEPPDGSAPSSLCSLSPCGGDLSGQWTFTRDCVGQRPPPTTECTAQTYFATALEGTVEFSPDGTAEFTTRLVQDTLIWLPKSCLPANQTCAGAVTFTPPVTGWCSDDGDVCNCRSTTDQEFETESLAYAVDGSELVLDGADGPIHFDYCARGGELRYVHDTGEATVARRADLSTRD